MLRYYINLLFYFHFSFRFKFFFSQFKKKYLPKGILIDSKTTKKFYKNLKSIAIFNYWYQSLHNKKLSNHDLVNTYYYPLLWTLQDEQTDNQPGSDTMLRFELLKEIRTELRNRVPNSFLFDSLGSNLVEKQIKSQLQKELSISIDQLEKAEEEKAGYSFPFYACLIDFPPIKNQFQILYDFGVILQHIDDILDIHEDIHEGTKTMANLLAINDFETFLDQKRSEFLVRLKEVNASKKTIMISLICFGVGFVQIENLKRLMNKSQKHDYNSFDRKQLICDMARLTNIFKHYQIIKASILSNH